MISTDLRQNLKNSSRTILKQLDHLSGGTLNILVEAVRHFNRLRAAEAAAGLAYFALFSLFPLILTLIALGSFLLESARVQNQLLNLVRENVPVSQQLIQQNIQMLLDLRGAVGLVSLVGLLWAATVVFNTLSYHINRAWKAGEVRGFLERRLVALGIVGSLAGLLILSILVSAIFNLLAQIRVPLIDNLSLYGLSIGDVLDSLFSNLLPILLRLLIFLGLYRWVPNTRVNWRDAFWGAIVATLGWEIATVAFTWYLSSGFGRFELVYGSLGTIIGLMVWIYLGSLVTLFGAHLSAAAAAGRQRNEKSRNQVIAPLNRPPP